MEEETMKIYEDAALSVAGTGPQENNSHQRSVSFAFSLQILSGESLSIKGDVQMQRASIPQRASRPRVQPHQPPPVTIDDEYDDQLPGITPRSQLRYKPIVAQQPSIITRTTDQLTPPKTRHQWSPMWYLALPALVAVLFFTALPGLERQWHRGDHGTQVWTINGDTFTAWTDDDAVDILVYPHGDKSHAQLVPSKVIGSHTSSVTIDLMQQDNGVLVFLNNTQVGHLVPDGKGGYAWQ